MIILQRDGKAHTRPARPFFCIHLSRRDHLEPRWAMVAVVIQEIFVRNDMLKEDVQQINAYKIKRSRIQVSIPAKTCLEKHFTGLVHRQTEGPSVILQDIVMISGRQSC